jgi:hypothetical protein
MGAWAASLASLMSSDFSSSYCRFSRNSGMTMRGMATMMIQAPCVKLKMAEMTSTTTEMRAPTPLMNRPDLQPFCLRRLWWIVIPACDRANPVKTPMAYMGMRRSTLAPEKTSRKMAAAVRAMMPLEKTSRWPRLVSWRGMKLSLAWKLARRGKSA